MADLAASNVTVTVESSRRGGVKERRNQVKIDFGNGSLTYPAAGVPLPAASAFGLQHELRYLLLIDENDGSGFAWKYDKANKKLRAWQSAAISQVGQTVNVKDDDNAASTGVAVYVHVDEVTEQGLYLAHLEFVSPTNADGTGLIATGGAQYRLQDDDAAASGGVALYLDEDAADTDERLLANLTHGQPVFIMLSNGELIKVMHNADPGTPGVQVYFDEDAANAFERLLFVSPTNVNATLRTEPNVAMRRDDQSAMALAELGNVAVAAQTMYAEAIGW